MKIKKVWNSIMPLLLFFLLNTSSHADTIAPGPEPGVSNSILAPLVIIGMMIAIGIIAVISIAILVIIYVVIKKENKNEDKKA